MTLFFYNGGGWRPRYEDLLLSNIVVLTRYFCERNEGVENFVVYHLRFTPVCPDRKARRGDKDGSPERFVHRIVSTAVRWRGEREAAFTKKVEGS